MGYNEFDTLDDDAEYPEDDAELVESDALRRSGRGASVTVSLSWQQIAFIIGINAVLSLIISLVVVIVAGQRFVPSQSEPIPPPAVAAESPAVVNDGSSELPPPALDTPTPASAEVPPAVESAPSEPSPTSTPVEPTIYIVQPGDSLGSIAIKFEVTMEDLMRANDLTDPDYVQVGQELLIPIGGLPPATPTFTPIPAPTDTPLPFNPPTPLPSGVAPPAEPAATVGPTPTPVPTLTSASATEVRLVLQVANPGDLANEMVQIVNQGPFVRLTDWTLSDEGESVYTFPEFSLWGGGTINVHTAGGTNTATDLYWGQPASVWDPGEQVTLRDTEAEVVASSTVPTP
jgi:LysM repeat protein